MTGWLGRMAPRSASEPHRVSTSLEALFDLVFVVAVSFAGTGLHHDLSAHHIQHGITSYVPIFFAIWIAWLNYAWFASAYDIDDVPYRLMVFLQMTGALVLAAGVPRAFEEHDFRLIVIGYVIMRVAQVGQWLRAAYSDPEHRKTALRYAIGTTVLQIGWVYFGFVMSSFSWLAFFALALLEVAVPAWAERSGQTSWNPHHISERYGLFTIIVLGEAVLASSLALQSVVSERSFDADRIAITAGAILAIYAMWWIYFEYNAAELLTSMRTAFFWGYGHLFLWGAIAAVGAGIAVLVDFAGGESALTRTQAQLALAIPVALFLTCLWLFHDFTGASRPALRFATPVAAVLVLATSLVRFAPLWIAIVLILLLVVRAERQPKPNHQPS